jgi:hypothetical protein
VQPKGTLPWSWQPSTRSYSKAEEQIVNRYNEIAVKRVINSRKSNILHYTHWVWLQFLWHSFELQWPLALIGVYPKAFSFLCCCLYTGLLLWCPVSMTSLVSCWECDGGRFRMQRCFQWQHTQTVAGTNMRAAGMRNNSGSGGDAALSAVPCSAKKAKEESYTMRWYTCLLHSYLMFLHTLKIKTNVIVTNMT